MEEEDHEQRCDERGDELEAAAEARTVKNIVVKGMSLLSQYAAAFGTTTQKMKISE